MQMLLTVFTMLGAVHVGGVTTTGTTTDPVCMTAAALVGWALSVQFHVPAVRVLVGVITPVAAIIVPATVVLPLVKLMLLPVKETPLGSAKVSAPVAALRVTVMAANCAAVSGGQDAGTSASAAAWLTVEVSVMPPAQVLALV